MLKGRAANETVGPLGFSYKAAFDALLADANRYRSTVLTYTVGIPNLGGSGTTNWSYTFSSSPPPPHPPGTDKYPPWTILSRLIQTRMETLVFAGAITGDATYWRHASGTGAIDMALAVAAWPTWSDPESQCCCRAKGQPMRSCLDTSHFSQAVGFVYDVAYASLTETERSTLRTALLEKGLAPLAIDQRNVNADPSGVASNYISLRLTGLAVGGCAVAAEGGAEAAEHMALAFTSGQQFIAGQGRDGGAFEGQLYGSYAVDNLMAAAATLARKGAGDLFADPWLGQIDRFVYPFLGSDNRTLANFGDSTECAGSLLPCNLTYWAPSLAVLASRGSANAQWLLSVAKPLPKTPRDFIWSNPTLIPQAPAGTGSALFPEVGHAALRAGFVGAPVVTIKSGPTTTSVQHNHYDANSVLLNVNGAWVAADPGYRDWYAPAANAYTIRSVGHNTLLVDGTVSADGATTSGGQTALVGGSLDGYFDTPGYGTVVGHAAATYAAGLLSRFDRKVIYDKPNVVFLLDDVAAPASHVYSLLLHGGEGSSITVGGGQARSIRDEGRIEAFQVADAPLTATVKGYPNASLYGQYVEWKSSPVANLHAYAAWVPSPFPHVALANAGFEQGLSRWTPRAVDATHTSDTATARTGTKSGLIAFSAAGTGYFYSEPLSLRPGATAQASAYFKTDQAAGTVSMQLFYMKDGNYLPQPGGASASVTVTAGSHPNWTALGTTVDPAPQAADRVRVALRFSGTGKVWFDDAVLTTTPVAMAPAASSFAAIGSPPSGIVVRGDYGTSGAGRGADNGVAVEGFSGVEAVASNAAVYSFAFAPNGQFRKVLLAGGSHLDINGSRVVQTSTMVHAAIELENNALAVWGKNTSPEVTFEVRVGSSVPSDVKMNGVAVPFQMEDGIVKFPAASTGPGPGPGQPNTPYPSATVTSGCNMALPASDATPHPYVVFLFVLCSLFRACWQKGRGWLGVSPRTSTARRLNRSRDPQTLQQLPC